MYFNQNFLFCIVVRKILIVPLYYLLINISLFGQTSDTPLNTNHFKKANNADQFFEVVETKNLGVYVDIKTWSVEEYKSRGRTNVHGKVETYGGYRFQNLDKKSCLYSFTPLLKTEKRWSPYRNATSYGNFYIELSFDDTETIEYLTDLAFKELGFDFFDGDTRVIQRQFRSVNGIDRLLMLHLEMDGEIVEAEGMEAETFTLTYVGYIYVDKENINQFFVVIPKLLLSNSCEKNVFEFLNGIDR